MYPQINNEMHFFLQEKKLYGLTLTNNTPTREIDFEEDPWRQDYQYVLVPPDDKAAQTIEYKAVLLIDLEEHMEKDEVILPHYICRINKFKAAIFFLKESKQITRGVLVEFSPYAEKTVKKLRGPPSDLFRPGCAPQNMDGMILDDILFLGGNEQLECFNYNISKDEWTPAGTLPKFHLVTETITLVHKGQTITLYVQVNFDNNCF